MVQAQMIPQYGTMWNEAIDTYNNLAPKEMESRYKNADAYTTRELEFSKKFQPQVAQQQLDLYKQFYPQYSELSSPGLQAGKEKLFGQLQGDYDAMRQGQFSNPQMMQLAANTRQFNAGSAAKGTGFSPYSNLMSGVNRLGILNGFQQQGLSNYSNFMNQSYQPFMPQDFSGGFKSTFSSNPTDYQMDLPTDSIYNIYANNASNKLAADMANQKAKSAKQQGWMNLAGSAIGAVGSLGGGLIGGLAGGALGGAAGGSAGGSSASTGATWG
jgi:hypothetical protein